MYKTITTARCPSASEFHPLFLCCFTIIPYYVSNNLDYGGL
nr:MAG TPA: hypothetical protein [Caudoviricetes sp.]